MYMPHVHARNATKKMASMRYRYRAAGQPGINRKAGGRSGGGPYMLHVYVALHIGRGVVLVRQSAK
jgi:hypothetical protein